MITTDSIILSPQLKAHPPPHTHTHTRTTFARIYIHLHTFALLSTIFSVLPCVCPFRTKDVKTRLGQDELQCWLRYKVSSDSAKSPKPNFKTRPTVTSVTFSVARTHRLNTYCLLYRSHTHTQHQWLSPQLFSQDRSRHAVSSRCPPTDSSPNFSSFSARECEQRSVTARRPLVEE